MKTTIQSEGEAMPDHTAIQAYRHLEDAICRAHCMSVVVDNMLDRLFRKPDADGYWHVTLGKEDMNATFFAWKELRNLTRIVQEDFYKVEEEGQANG